MDTADNVGVSQPHCDAGRTCSRCSNASVRRTDVDTAAVRSVGDSEQSERCIFCLVADGNQYVALHAGLNEQALQFEESLSSHCACAGCWLAWQHREARNYGRRHVSGVFAGSSFLADAGCPVCQRLVDICRGYSDASRLCAECFERTLLPNQGQRIVNAKLISAPSSRRCRICSWAAAAVVLCLMALASLAMSWLQEVVSSFVLEPTLQQLETRSLDSSVARVLPPAVWAILCKPFTELESEERPPRVHYLNYILGRFGIEMGGTPLVAILAHHFGFGFSPFAHLLEEFVLQACSGQTGVAARERRQRTQRWLGYNEEADERKDGRSEAQAETVIPISREEL